MDFKKQGTEKWAYVKPEVKLFVLENELSLMAASGEPGFNGQHNNANHQEGPGEEEDQFTLFLSRLKCNQLFF